MSIRTRNSNLGNSSHRNLLASKANGLAETERPRTSVGASTDSGLPGGFSTSKWLALDNETRRAFESLREEWFAL